MNDMEWKTFIKEITNKKVVNLKKECKQREVGLNTLYRTVSLLENTDNELYNKFMNMYPYQPRDIEEVDFEQIMRESILTGISQSELQEKYGFTKRTIQRKFANIGQTNERLYEIYKMYVECLRSGKELPEDIIIEVSKSYKPQEVRTRCQNLENRKEKFRERIKQIEMENNGTRQLKYYYKEQEKRVEQIIRNMREEK